MLATTRNSQIFLNFFIYSAKNYTVGLQPDFKPK